MKIMILSIACAMSTLALAGQTFEETFNEIRVWETVKSRSSIEFTITRHHYHNGDQVFKTDYQVSSSEHFGAYPFVDQPEEFKCSLETNGRWTEAEVLELFEIPEEVAVTSLEDLEWKDRGDRITFRTESKLKLRGGTSIVTLKYLDFMDYRPARVHIREERECLETRWEESDGESPEREVCVKYGKVIEKNLAMSSLGVAENGKRVNLQCGVRTRLNLQKEDISFMEFLLGTKNLLNFY